MPYIYDIDNKRINKICDDKTLFILYNPYINNSLIEKIKYRLNLIEYNEEDDTHQWKVYIQYEYLCQYNSKQKYLLARKIIKFIKIIGEIVTYKLWIEVLGNPLLILVINVYKDKITYNYFDKEKKEILDANKMNNFLNLIQKAFEEYYECEKM